MHIDCVLSMLTAGQKISHYRVLSQIGAGGMGVVFLAHDEQLERKVAIKVLPPGSPEEENARRLFRKEALALARLNHPNIATIFEFGQEQGRDFLVTEYIPGVTLDDKLAAGPLTVEEAIGLGTQLATGLAAAHERGLVHRDLKPGNLRVTPDGRLKILDFGLAQLAHRASELGDTVTVTKTQEVAGTLPYMAPEQLRLGVADARTDLWAAGAVLHEMLTGTRAFPESGMPALVESILHSTPAAPSKSNPKVPSRLDHVVEKALQKDASRRYQSATELGSDLQLVLSGTPLLVQKRLATLIALAGLVLLLLLTATYVYHRKIQGQTLSRRSVAVLGFQNLSGNADQNWLSIALSEMLTTELASGDRLRTVPGETVSRAKSDLALADAESLGSQTLIKLYRVLGADLVVLGSYLDMDGQIRVDVRVQSASDGDTVAKFFETGTEAQIFELVQRVGETLREKCGAGEITTEQATSIRASLPVNSEAVKLYSQGLEKLRAFDAIPARDLLVQAIDKDPNYALAHEALASAWSQLGYDGRAKDESKRAFELASGLPRQEALAIEARYREEARDWNKAIEIYQSLWTVFPDEPEHGLRLASAQVSDGRGQDALTTIQRLTQSSPQTRDDPRVDLAEAAAAASLSDYSRAAKASQTAIHKAQQTGSEGLQAEGLLQECWALRNLGSPEQARTAGTKAGEMLESRGDLRGKARSITCVANVLADQGELSSAQKMHEQALELAHKVGAQKDTAGALINLGNVLASQQNLVESTRKYKLALGLATSIGDKGDALLAENNLGANFSLQGDYVGARKSFENSVGTAREIGDQAGVVEALINLAFVSLLQGDLESARADLAESVSKAQALHLKSRLATALTGMGDVLLAQDDLAGAQHSYEQSLAIRSELGEKGGMANSQLSIALVALENEHPEKAESLARGAVQEFAKESDDDQRAGAEDVLAQALIAQQRWQEAKKEMAAAGKLTVRDLPTSLSLLITGALLDARVGAVIEAKRKSNDAVGKAVVRNLVELEWRARLVLAEAEIKQGQLPLAAATLQVVKTGATRRGFRLLARKANQLANSTRKEISANASPPLAVSQPQ